MGTFVIVDKATVKKGLKGLKKLLDKDPELKNERAKERKEFAAEKKRRDAEHRAKTLTRTRG